MLRFLIKDLLNINLWVKSLKNPEKAKKAIITRFFSYPGKRLGKIKNLFIRNIFLNIWLLLAKKNKSLYNYFFSHKKIEGDFQSKNNFTFSNIKLDEKIDENVFLSLKNNGIIILKNILSKSEHNKIIQRFNDLEINSENSINSWIKGPHNITKSNLIDLFWAMDNIEKYPELKSISKKITTEIYGKEVIPTSEFYWHKSLKCPEEIIQGENHLHMDRYIPNLKMYYSPFQITEQDAPFQWVLGSHKINEEYINYWKNSKNYNEIEDKKNSEYLKKIPENNKIRAMVDANSLIAVFTNGLHCRSPFLKKDRNRKVVFLHYGSFNKLSLLNFKSYNSNIKDTKELN